MKSRGGEDSVPRIEITVASNESGQSALSNRKTSVSVEVSFQAMRKLISFGDRLITVIGRLKPVWEKS